MINVGANTDCDTRTLFHDLRNNNGQYVAKHPSCFPAETVGYEWSICGVSVTKDDISELIS